MHNLIFNFFKIYIYNLAEFIKGFGAVQKGVQRSLLDAVFLKKIFQKKVNSAQFIKGFVAVRQRPSNRQSPAKAFTVPRNVLGTSEVKCVAAILGKVYFRGS